MTELDRMIRQYLKDNLTIHAESSTAYPSFGNAPPYQKLTVTLKLGDEEISSDWVEVPLDE